MVVGEDPDLDGAPLELLLDGALNEVRSAQASAMILGQREYSQAFGNGVFQPCRETGGRIAVSGNELVERDLGLGERGCIPDAAQLGTDALADGGVGGMVDGVCGEVELAALPGLPRRRPG